MAGEAVRVCLPECLIEEDNSSAFKGIPSTLKQGGMELNDSVPQNGKSNGSRRQKWRQKNTAQAKGSASHKRNASPLSFGGPGMQAFFLTSGGSATTGGSRNGSSGTGFFLPRRPGTSSHPWHKPACATVLLPSRVVHALNQSAHRLAPHSGVFHQGTVRKPVDQERDRRSYEYRDYWNLNSTNDDSVGLEDGASQFLAASRSRSPSPEPLCLPNEWTY
ncbi:uncharacterized protein LOC116259837 [Nymphaea colorata]|uniref:uncharacterized protein LOC116259837 n=1 Tax=Nymphaea colorata TaxID=210225 RepID=UPI00214E2AA9|nr:uncharacterized protein LOC116259837 [Nymphaea colorata]